MILLAKSADRAGRCETLLDHTIHVIETVRKLYVRLPNSRIWPSGLLPNLEIAAAIHDVGKAATGFQDMVAGRTRDWKGRRHEVLSASFASALGFPEEVVFAILTHHKRIPDLLDLEGDTPLRFHFGKPEDWDNIVREFEINRAPFREVWTQITDHIWLSKLQANAEVVLQPSFIRPAWRQADNQKREIPFEARLNASLIRGLLVSADHLASAQIDPPTPLDLKLFPPSNWMARPFQNSAAIDGNLILRAPTGSGKTEAVLLWAAKNQPQNGRLFYTLPYTSALNAMFQRLLKHFPDDRDAIGLLHGRAAHHLFQSMQQETPTDPQAAQSLAIAKVRLAREMYHTVRVCTPHQLLRYTLRGKGWDQILAEIPGACVVFDEVHSYNPALAGLTLGTARLFHQLGAKLAFASATMPEFLERIICDLVPCEVVKPDPENEKDAKILNRLRHRLRIDDCSLLDLASEIKQCVEAGKKILVVCNHVRSAQSVAKELRKKIGEDRVVLFHSRFNMKDRIAIEALLASSELPAILVATQVVEVSLDISFDLGYFEAAPIDALAQRMGRVNRNPEAGFPPALVVIASKQLNSYPIYESEITAATLRNLAQLQRPISESDLVNICNEVYASGYQGQNLADFQEHLNHKYLTQFDKQMVAGFYENWVEHIIEIESRLDVLPESLQPKFDALMKQGRWLEADQLTVSIRARKSLDKYIDKQHDPYVIRLPYGPDGLNTP